MGRAKQTQKVPAAEGASTTRKSKEKKWSEEDQELARTALLEAVEAEDQQLTRLFGTSDSGRRRNNKRQDGIRLLKKGLTVATQKELILFTIATGLDKQHARRFFSGLAAILDDVEDVVHNLQEADQDQESIFLLYCAALAVRAYSESQIGKQTSSRKPQRMSSDGVDDCKAISIIREAVEVAEILHGCLLPLDRLCTNSDDNSPTTAQQQAKTTILSLCELWWHQKMEFRNSVVSNTITLLVRDVVYDGDHGGKAGGGTMKAKVKRVFMMRHILNEISFGGSDDDDSSSEEDPSHELRNWLLQTATFPSMLKLAEGKRLLAYLISQVDEGSLLEDLHRAVKAQLPRASKTILKAYGQVYFRAWKEASPAVQARFEGSALSDLTQLSIHLANDSTRQAVLTVLQPFFTAQATAAVKAALFRLYGPIVWRCLSMTHALVRVQAADVLGRVWPLEPLQGPAPARTSAVLKATDALMALMQDEDDRVRVAGSQATARILSTHWTTVPTEGIRGLLTEIIANHASDARCPAVRVAAVDAVTLLLEQQAASQAVLRPLLPRLGNLIHDKHPTVRLAVVRMLHAVKDIKGIRFFHVVPLEHLLARLVEDATTNKKKPNPVASSLARLLLNSFVPQGDKASPVELVKRTLRLLNQNPGAAKVFYRHLELHVPLMTVAQLVSLLFRHLHKCCTTEQPAAGSRKKRKGGKDRSVQPDDRSQLLTHDFGVLAALAESIYILLQSIQEDRSEAYVEAMELVTDAFSVKRLVDILRCCDRSKECEVEEDPTGQRERSNKLCSAILQSIGSLRPETTDFMAPHLSACLCSMLEDSIQPGQADMTSFVALLCACGKAKDVAASLAKSIQAPFDSGLDLFASPVKDTKKRPRRGSAKVKQKAAVLPELNHTAALVILAEILRGSDPLCCAARSFLLDESTALVRALKSGFRFVEEGLVTAEVMKAYSLTQEEIHYAVCVCETYGRFMLHKAAQSDPEFRSQFSAEAIELLERTTSYVLPALGPPFEDSDISRISITRDSLPPPISPGPPRRRQNRNSTPPANHRSSRDECSITSGDEAAALARALSVALVQSSLLMFGEWVAVGGAGGDSIANEVASRWTAVFATAGNDLEANELLPSFCDLAFHLCKSAGNFDLLKRLIQVVEPSTEFDYLEKVLSVLLASATTVRATAECVVQVAHKCRPTEADIFNKPTSVDELWPGDDPPGSVQLALGAVVPQKQGALAMARLLAQELEQDAERNAQIFSVHVLFLLCQHYPKELVPVLHELHLDKFADDISALVKDMMDEPSDKSTGAVDALKPLREDEAAQDATTDKENTEAIART